MDYSEEIHDVVRCALDELLKQHQTNKLADTPITNTHFLARWITTSIKKQRFSTKVKADLLRWQKKSRSQGASANLLAEFKAIDRLYSAFFGLDSKNQIKGEGEVTDKQIEDFMDHIEKQGFEVVNEFEVLDKIQVFSDGPNSFVLCALECEKCFEDVNLVRPMRFFVRGNHAQFIEQATSHGFLLHKQTDYKSKVKYHGEYTIFPKNKGNKLAEIPLSYFK